MKLGQVVLASDAFNHLATLRMPPQMAYRLLKYVRLLSAERELAEQRRVAIIRKVSGVSEGNVNLDAGTPEYQQFVAEYGEALEVEVDLPELDDTLKELLDAIGTESSLTVTDLANLEPFFASE
jgi:hypothetical protein